MSNDYFNSSAPITRQTLARSTSVNAIAAALVAAFDKLPTRNAIWRSTHQFGTTTGTAGVYALSLADTSFALDTGTIVRCVINVANTGASSLNVNGTGARVIKRIDGTDVEAGDLYTGAFVELGYNGTNWVLLSGSPVHMAGIASVLGAALSFTGAVTFSGSATFTAVPSFPGNPVFSGNPSFTGSPSFAAVGNKATIRSDLGVQQSNGNLSALAGLTGVADRIAYFTGAAAMALATLTSFGRSLIAAVDAAAARVLLGLRIGVDVQAYNPNLSSLSGLTFAANKGLYTTAANTAALFDLTAAGRALLDDANAAAQRSTLGLGSLATLNTVGTAQIDSGEQMTAANVSDAYAARALDEIGQMRLMTIQYGNGTGNPYAIGSTYSGSTWGLTGTWRVMGATSVSYTYFSNEYTQWLWLLKRTA